MKFTFCGNVDCPEWVLAQPTERTSGRTKRAVSLNWADRAELAELHLRRPISMSVALARRFRAAAARAQRTTTLSTAAAHRRHPALVYAAPEQPQGIGVTVNRQTEMLELTNLVEGAQNLSEHLPKM